MKKKLTIDEIRTKGFNALTDALGPDGMIRFLQQFDSGKGNYTKDRSKWLDNYDINSIAGELGKDE